MYLSVYSVPNHTSFSPNCICTHTIIYLFTRLPIYSLIYPYTYANIHSITVRKHAYKPSIHPFVPLSSYPLIQVPNYFRNHSRTHISGYLYLYLVLPIYPSIFLPTDMFTNNNSNNSNTTTNNNENRKLSNDKHCRKNSKNKTKILSDMKISKA
jgi:hypothetical protein